MNEALNLVMHRKLCDHEAGHAASALIGGLDVREVRAGFYDLSEPTNPDEPAGHVLMAVGHDDPAELREKAIAVLAGPICEDRPDWPPRWPLLAPVTDDQRQLGQLAGALQLDEKGYSELVDDAYKRTTTREFERLHIAVSELLRHGQILDARNLEDLHKIAAEAGMERMTLKAVATATDLGQFEAVISSEAVDREQDIVLADVMVDAL
jgi:hypothetical protein